MFRQQTVAAIVLNVNMAADVLARSAAVGRRAGGQLSSHKCTRLCVTVRVHDGTTFSNLPPALAV